MEGLSFSNTLSKGSVYESDSIYAAYLEDAASQLAEGAAPVAISGFFSYNGLTLEQFLWAVLKTEFLCAGPRKFISQSFYYQFWRRKEELDFD